MVINLTPHEVTVLDEQQNVLVRIPSAGVARAVQRDENAGSVQVEGINVPVVTTAFGDTDGLPEPTEGVSYVVSIITANAARAQGRSTTDLLITSGPVRNAAGAIIGCTRFARV